MIPPRDSIPQDTVDGYAMRMLRAALPPGWTFTVEASDYEGAEFYVYAYEPGASPGTPPWESGVSRDGMTIAEAADAVREALELGQR
jgi:hypothetical protein